MIPAACIEICLNLIKKVKEHNKGYITNFFLDIKKLSLWIKLGLLEYESNEETVILLRKNQGFYNLYFITTSIDALKNDLACFLSKHRNQLFIADMVGKRNDISVLKEVFSQTGFYKYTSLVRMSRLIKETYSDEVNKVWLSFANDKKGLEVHELLKEYFDAYAEQLPLIEEIDSWIEKKRIVIYSDDNKTVQGFLIFELIGKTSYLKYWFVHPDHREKKIGSLLLRYYLSESKASTRQLFWVLESNENAIKRYEHFNFKKEDLFDYVMINRDIRYEK